MVSWVVYPDLVPGSSSLLLTMILLIGELLTALCDYILLLGVSLVLVLAGYQSYRVQRSEGLAVRDQWLQFWCMFTLGHLGWGLLDVLLDFAAWSLGIWLPSFFFWLPFRSLLKLAFYGWVIFCGGAQTLYAAFGHRAFLGLENALAKLQVTVPLIAKALDALERVTAGSGAAPLKTGVEANLSPTYGLPCTLPLCASSLSPPCFPVQASPFSCSLALCPLLFLLFAAAVACFIS